MNEEERQFVDQYYNISKYIFEQIRGLAEDKRMLYLRAAEPNDTSLMNLYLQALKKEDYETCEPAKALLLERGFRIPK